MERNNNRKKNEKKDQEKKTRRSDSRVGRVPTSLSAPHIKVYCVSKFISLDPKGDFKAYGIPLIIILDSRQSGLEPDYESD